MRHQSNLRRVLLPIVAIWPLILMATSGGPGVAARDAGPVPALDCPPCDDFNPCTVDSCDVANGTCRHDPLNCDDGNSCTVDSGSIVCQGDSTLCDDGDPCTQDTCDPATGLCGAAPIDCDDGNACTTDACDPATGACVRSNNPGPCSDGNLCTEDDACSGGNC